MCLKLKNEYPVIAGKIAKCGDRYQFFVPNGVPIQEIIEDDKILMYLLKFNNPFEVRMGSPFNVAEVELTGSFVPNLQARHFRIWELSVQMVAFAS